MIDLVVLAAGRGRRLGALGDDTPKWLLEVRGITVAERQLEAVDRVVRRSPDLVRSIHVVVGHAAGAIERFAARRAGTEIELVDNPSYDELNNWYSLLLALRALDRADEAERVVVFNADLIANADWFARFLLDSASAASESLIAVDTMRPLTDEAMKVAVVSDAPNLLNRIGKCVEDPVGEYVGMFMVRGTARGMLGETLETYVGSEAAAENWYEHAIEQTVRDGMAWVIWPTPDRAWIEIDDEADYAAALRLDDLR